MSNAMFEVRGYAVIVFLVRHNRPKALNTAHVTVSVR